MFQIKKIFSTFSFIKCLLLFIWIFYPESVFAEVNTIVNSIEKSGIQINREQWNKIIAGQNDSLTFYFSLNENGDSPNSNNVIYKIFLTGSSSVPELDSYKNEYYTVKNLNPGEYLFKVQGFIGGNIETTPAIIRFKIVENLNIGKSDENSTSRGVRGAFENNITLILIISVIAIILIIAFLFLRKIINRNSGNIKLDDGHKSKRVLTSDKIQSLKKISSENTQGTITEEHFDYKYAYENLKKENDKLRDENIFLKGQIDGLKSNVKDLETANVQLAAQKDRLLESKRQLEELHAQKEELLTIVLHDIKNPAAAIKGFVELLESYDLNANEQQEIMHSLVDTSSKILELAQEMSVVLAKQSKGPVITPEKASVKVITDAVCKRNFAYAKKKGINLINNTSPNTPETLIDVNKIEEVMDNLVNNSIKYSSPGTTVYVRSFFSDSKITIEVEDNGVGLSEDDVKKAFKKGVLLSTKPTGDETRSGLGLWISKKIIEDHGGNIWIKSKLGIGTTVGFELPIKR